MNELILKPANTAAPEPTAGKPFIPPKSSANVKNIQSLQANKDNLIEELSKAIKRCDILLTADKGIISATIRLFDNAEYSHGILCKGDNKIIESLGKGVTENDLRKIFDNIKSIAVLRDQNMTEEQCDVMLDFAAKQIGKSYNFFGALWAPTIIKTSSSNDKYYCTELILEAREEAGLPSEIEPNKSTPNNLYTDANKPNPPLKVVFEYKSEQESILLRILRYNSLILVLRLLFSLIKK
ncbi:hypothetical protein C7N43_25985 [Sphingobacteriales bacterium UPWRP_1]|nr:hypothetical protein BVG80_17790 [Sphingobacteriales bacterium TSM_CSM]PSJ74046.1 hypothetical protein C7N43_25985 [Sphingobacteriales bacterium UPWRP_1]